LNIFETGKVDEIKKELWSRSGPEPVYGEYGRNRGIRPKETLVFEEEFVAAK
jgi:hypothetical protein